MSTKKNSFSFFLDDYVNEQRQKGRNISKRIASEECGPLWTTLTPEMKEKYFEMARIYKCEQEFMKEKLASQFEVPSGYQEEKPGCEISYLAAHIRHEKALKNHNFYIIHCNYYCRTEEGYYLPAELAFLEFNLEEGIKQTYHTLISPDKIPLGYAYEVRRVINEVHGLPFPPHEKGEKNYDQILNTIYLFMKSSKENEDEYPPLFTIEENVQATREILQVLSRNDKSTWPILKVYPIHRMFFWLKNKCTEYCGNEPGFPVVSNAISEIEKDVFRYCTGISCKHHSELPDKFQTCSLSIVQRLVYIICDHCCRHLHIKLVRGKHIHWNFIRRTGESSERSGPSNISDTASIPYEESEFCGASTYASSIVDDSRYKSVEKNYVEEESVDYVTEKVLHQLKFESDDDENASCLMKNRGRGRQTGNTQ